VYTRTHGGNFASIMTVIGGNFCHIRNIWIEILKRPTHCLPFYSR